MGEAVADAVASAEADAVTGVDVASEEASSHA